MTPWVLKLQRGITTITFYSLQHREHWGFRESGDLMKSFVIALFMVLSYAASAVDYVDAQGGAWYKQGKDVTSKKLVLSAPVEGKGPFLLTDGKIKLESHAFKVTKAHGRTGVSIVFIDIPGMPANTALIMEGAYLNGANAVVYWGDVYVMSFKNKKTLTPEFLTSMKKDHHHGVMFTGGFAFSANAAKK